MGPRPRVFPRGGGEVAKIPENRDFAGYLYERIARADGLYFSVLLLIVT
jgi:hypothetical protein